MTKLDKYMQNMGRGQFTYEVFKAAYDSDPRLQNLVADFDEQKLKLKNDETDDLEEPNANGGDSVSQMAKSAVDLKDL